jgi:hypothetical protein
MVGDEMVQDPQQPRQRRIASRSVAAARAKRAREHLAGQILGEVAADPPRQISPHPASVTLPQRAKPDRIIDRGHQHLLIRSRVAHT